MGFRTVSIILIQLMFIRETRGRRKDPCKKSLPGRDQSGNETAALSDQDESRRRKEVSGGAAAASD